MTEGSPFGFSFAHPWVLLFLLLLPILAIMLPPPVWVVPVVSGASLLCLAALGALAAQVGGGSAWRGAVRVAFWGALAMLATAGVGALFGTTVA